MRSLLLTLLIAAIAVPVWSDDNGSFPVANTNPRGQRDFPGGRGEDQLIVYTRAYNARSTGTNEWGVEAVVNDSGIVISVGGNNSRIPRRGYVLSGHGKAKDWLLQHVRVGARVAIAGRRASVQYGAASFRYLAESRGRALRARFRAHPAWLTSREKREVRRLFRELDSVTLLCRHIAVPESGAGLYVSGTRLLDNLDYRITPSPAREQRGVWHRPTERTAAQIDSTVSRFARAGFTMLFVETIWGGETIYPGHITEQKKQFAGFDPLRVFIDAGKRYGIAIHAWVHTFFVGMEEENGDGDPGPILRRHPEWALVKRNGEKVSRAENGYLWVCPARPEVQEFIASLYHEIVTTYRDIGGVQLDYARYPVNASLDESSCYCDFCRASFRRVAGVDPMKITPERNPRVWARWTRWREENISRFVARVRRENPRVVISAAVFPDLEEARRTKMQNWAAWARSRNVSVLVPMIYTTSAKSVDESMRKVRAAAGPGVPVYAGLAPFMKLTPELLLDEIGAARNRKAAGLVFFASHSLSDSELSLLAAGPFRNRKLR